MGMNMLETRVRTGIASNILYSVHYVILPMLYSETKVSATERKRNLR